jgi:hypothetical protein
MRTGELLVRAARAVRAMYYPSVLASLARIQHGQTNQKFILKAHDYDKKKCSNNNSPIPISTFSQIKNIGERLFLD